MFELVSKDFKILKYIKKYGPIPIETLLIKFSDENYVTKSRVLNLFENNLIEKTYVKIENEYHALGYIKEYQDIYFITDNGRLIFQNKLIRNKEFITKELPLEIMRSIIFPAILSIITALIILKYF